MAKKAEEDTRNLREIAQKKFLDEVIGCAAGWKVLVMDDSSTKVISSALTMFDIMERKVTLVEQIARVRQPFPEMDVVYFVTPSRASFEKIISDFGAKPRYKDCHIVTTQPIPGELMSLLGANTTLISRLQTLKEIYIDFLTTETNVFQFDLHDCLSKLYGSLPDPDYPQLIGAKLATLCITLNELPSIRYQGSSHNAQRIADTLYHHILDYKRNNPDFWVWGEGEKASRERAQLLIVDRSFDPVSPLMHEFTYQAMVNDLLPVNNNVITYTSTTGRGTVTKEALLGESDPLWVEFRHAHIAKVINSVSARMKELALNSGGSKLAKGSGADMSITEMGAALKDIPEYQQTTAKLAQHVNTAQQCMEVFNGQDIFPLSDLEQAITTGVDEDGAACRGAKLLGMTLEQIPTLGTKELKIRLILIYFLAQRPSAEDKRQLITAAGLTGDDQQVFLNFERLLSNGGGIVPVSPSGAGGGGGGGGGAAPSKRGMFESMFGRSKGSAVSAPTSTDAQYAESRHVPSLRPLLEQLIRGELSGDQFPSMGPAISSGEGASKSAAKSVRRYANADKWGAKKESFEGGRIIAFVSGGLGYSETRAANEVMAITKKEILVGGTHLLNPQGLIDQITNLDSTGGAI